MHTPTVAYLTSRMPSPPLSGGQLREHNLLKRLGRSFDIHLWVATMFPEICATGVAEMRRHCRSVHIYTAEPPDGKPADVPLRVWQQRSAEMSADLTSFLQPDRIDLVHVEGYYMMQYLLGGMNIPVMLVEENVEYLIDRQQCLLMSESKSEPIWQYSKKLEMQAWRRASRCGVVSTEDQLQIRKLAPEIDPVYVPHGYNHLRLETTGPEIEPRREGNLVVFVGDYTYPPTHDAAVFLLKEIWPRVVAVAPKARLSIVGRGITKELRERATQVLGVELTGYVESVRDELDKADVFVCPLRAGGGVKLKMLEAIGQGVPTVSTSIGVQGLPQNLTAEMEVQDEPGAFADGIIRLLSDPGARKKHREALLDAAQGLPTWETAAQILHRAWQQLIVQKTVPQFSLGDDL